MATSSSPGGRWDERDGDLVLRTGVEGPAARLGHRLTLVLTRWRASVTERDGRPASVRVDVDLSGLQVRSGEGGLTPLSSPERAMVRRSALKALDVRRHPAASYVAESVTPVPGTHDPAHDLDGELTIRGVTRPLVLRVEAVPGAEGGRPAYRLRTTVRQSDHGVRPVSFLGGALVVADEVVVELALGSS